MSQYDKSDFEGGLIYTPIMTGLSQRGGQGRGRGRWATSCDDQHTEGKRKL